MKNNIVKSLLISIVFAGVFLPALNGIAPVMKKEKTPARELKWDPEKFQEKIENYREAILKQYLTAASIVARTNFDTSNEANKEEWDDFQERIKQLDKDSKTVMLAEELQTLTYNNANPIQIAWLIQIYEMVNDLKRVEDDILDINFFNIYEKASSLSQFVEHLGETGAPREINIWQKMHDPETDINELFDKLDKLILFNALALFELNKSLSNVKPSETDIGRVNELIGIMVKYKLLSKELAEKLKMS